MFTFPKDFRHWLMKKMLEGVHNNDQNRMQLSTLEVDRVEEVELLDSGYLLIEGEGVRYKISIEEVSPDEYPFDDEKSEE